MYPLFDKNHTKTEQDMTRISYVITENRELLRMQVLRITRKLYHQFESAVWQMSRQDRA